MAMVMQECRRLTVFCPGVGEIGGAAQRVRLILEGLVATGWEVRAVTRAGTRFVPRILRSRNLFVLEVPGFGLRRVGAIVFLAVSVPLGVWWGVRSAAFLAIQLMSPTTTAAVCSRLVRRPYICLTTSSGRLSELDYVLQTRTAGLRIRMLNRARVLIAQNSEMARELQSLVSTRVEVLPNPVKLAEPAKLDSLPRALFAGRLSAEKGLEDLLGGWRSIAAGHPEARLYLVGEGGRYRSVEKRLHAMVRADSILRSSVIFTGWVDDISELLTDSDVFVLPSHSEGMSNALLEACAAGRVVVASNIEANRAVLGNGYPLLFEPGDIPGLTTALRSALFDEQIRQLAVKHVLESIDQFSLEAVSARLDDLISDAADRPRH